MNVRRITVLVCYGLACLGNSILAAESPVFIALEASFLTPSGARNDYVIDDPTQDFRVRGPLREVEFSNEVNPRLRVGRRWANGGEFSVHYWEFDETGSDRVNNTTGELWPTDVTSSEDRSFSLIDAALVLGFPVSSRVTLHVGYEFSQWNDVIGVLQFPDDVNPTVTESTTEDLHWHGLTAGIRFLVGKGGK